MKRFQWLTAAVMVLGLAAGSVPAQEPAPTVDEIIQKTNHTAYYQGKDGRARIKMSIKDKQGNVREREFSILRQNKDDKDEEQNFFVYFHRPADVREMVFMVWKHVGKDDDRWLYLPALDVVRQIAASDERTSFVGSSFFYEDVSGRGIQEDTHELVETTNDYFVIKNTPKTPAAVEFDSYKMYIHNTTFIPVKIEYEKGGTVYRTGEALKVEDIQGFKTVTQSKMSDLNTGTETTLEYLKVEYDLGLKDDIFTERFMRRPPKEYLN